MCKILGSRIYLNKVLSADYIQGITYTQQGTILMLVQDDLQLEFSNKLSLAKPIQG